MKTILMPFLAGESCASITVQKPEKAESLGLRKILRAGRRKIGRVTISESVHRLRLGMKIRKQDLKRF